LPDHSSISKNRRGSFRQSGVFLHLFESVLRRCMKEGLVSGEGFAFDASVIKADASRARGSTSAEAAAWSEDESPTRAVREYLQASDAENPTDDEPPEGPQELHQRTSDSPMPKHAGPLRLRGLKGARDDLKVFSQSLGQERSPASPRPDRLQRWGTS